MSASNREVAHRVFAAEYDDATFSYSESDEERAPNYVVTPTGARVNRLFLVGVLTAVEQVSDDVLRGRIADPTGAFVVYAGQYQPDEMAFLERAEPPLFVAVTGKARTFSPDDSERVFTSVRPETITEVDADTRDRWTVQAAEQTLARVATFGAALDLGVSGDSLGAALRASGVPEGLVTGIPMARERYGTTEHYLAAVADLATDALAQVAGEADEVPPLSATPGDEGPGTVDRQALAAAVEGAVVDVQVPEDAADEAVPPDTEGPTDTEAAAAAATDRDEGGTATGDRGAGESASPGESATGEAPADDDGPGDAAPDEATTGEAEPADATAEGATGDAELAADEPDELGDFEPGGTAAAGGEESGATAAGGDEQGEASAAGSGDAGDGPTAAGDDEPTEDVLDDEERERLEEEYGTFSTGTEVDEPGEAGIEPEAGPIEPEAGPDDAESAPEPADTGTEEAGAAEAGAAEAGTGEAGAAEAGTGEGRTAEAGTGEGGTAEAGQDVGPEDTDRAAEPTEPDAETAEATSDVESEDEGAAETAADDGGEAGEPEQPASEDESAESPDSTSSGTAADVDLEEAVVDAMTELDDGDGAEREAVVAAVVDDHGVDPGAVEDAIQDALMAGRCYEPSDDRVKPI